MVTLAKYQIMNYELYRSSLSKLTNAVEEKGKTFLITGATGLIGTCLVDLLMLYNETDEKGNHIYALGRSTKKLESHFRKYLNYDSFDIIGQDICDQLDDKINFDYIIHGASYADPINYARYPVETMKTNLLGGINILEYAKKHQNCKVEILSTFEVYGKTEYDIHSEYDIGYLDFFKIRSSYPESKRALETLAISYREEYNLNVTIGRLCSVYGPTMNFDDSKAHAQFLRNAIEGKDIVLKSRGEQRRSYCYVLDAVTGILTVLFRGESGKAYNINNENSIVTISEMAEIIANMTGKHVVYELPSELEAKGFSTPQNCILDNTMLKALGWEGHYTINQGISECLSILI